MQKTYLILDNIRSTHNVGSAFRTADAADVSKIYLTGITPTPLDRFGRKQKDIAKVSLGSEDHISYEYFKTTKECIEHLRRKNVQIIGVEQSKNSLDYKKIKIDSPTAFIFGNEVNGISKEILEKCDSVIEIPMKGKKESLNVSVSIGIILFNM